MKETQSKFVESEFLSFIVLAAACSFTVKLPRTFPKNEEIACHIENQTLCPRGFTFHSLVALCYTRCIVVVMLWFMQWVW